MSGTVILAVVLAVIVVVGAVMLAMRTGPRGRDRDLRHRFGPEYDRLAERNGDQKAVERELGQRIHDRDALSLRPLEQDERERYELTWRSMQERFVDDPRGAAQQAGQIISGLLTALGYPSEDPERQLDLASVDHAQALGSYRQARDLALRAKNADSGSAAETETLREAVLRYRVMFNELIGQASAEPARAGR